MVILMMEVIVDWCMVILLGCLYTRSSSLPSTGWLPQWTVGLVVTISRARRPCHRRPMMMTPRGWDGAVQRRSRGGNNKPGEPLSSPPPSSSCSLFLAFFMIYEEWKWFGVACAPDTYTFLWLCVCLYASGWVCCVPFDLFTVFWIFLF